MHSARSRQAGPQLVRGTDFARGMRPAPVVLLPVGLAAFVGQYATSWNLLVAGAVIALLPVLLIYILAQNWFVKGTTLSGMGGR